MAIFRHVLAQLLIFHSLAYGQTPRIGERRAVIQVAQKYIGVRETGQNRGAPYTLFVKPYGYGPGTMYCGLFLHHVFTEAVIKHGVKGAALAANWSIPVKSIISRYGRPVSSRRPLAGDVALYTWGRGRICHVELVLNWPPDETYFWVIGGNTSNPANLKEEGVFAKRRSKRECLIVDRIDFYN